VLACDELKGVVAGTSRLHLTNTIPLNVPQLYLGASHSVFEAVPYATMALLLFKVPSVMFLADYLSTASASL
jgi:hypothetical protein